jgi:hypothetical protein
MNYSKEELEQLDLFLDFFFEENRLMDVNSVINFLMIKTKLIQGDVISIVYKLEKDGYLVRDKSDKQIIISFDGKVLKRNGSYTKLQEINEKIQLRSIEERQKQENRDEKMTNFQGWIVAATILMGLYSLIQIVKIFLPFHHLWH